MSEDVYLYVAFGVIKSTKSPGIVVSAFLFGVGVFVSFTAPAATFIDTVPLQSEYSLS